MTKVRFKAYINDNYIYLLDCKKNTICEGKFNYLKNDEIINERKFYFEFNQFIKKNKIKLSLFGYNIQIICNDNLNLVQKDKYKELFLDYFKKVEFIDITSFLDLERNAIAINITENYLDFYFSKKNEKQIIRIFKLIFNNNDYRLIIHFFNTIFTPKKIIIFGTSELIPKLTEKINKELRIKCSYQEEYSKYILNFETKK